MEKLIYEKMRNANRASLEAWLTDFLIFTKSEKLQPKDLIHSSSAWSEAFSSEKDYLKWKRLGYEILKYSVKTYIFYYHKEAFTPKELTNMTQPALDAARIVEFFNMNFFNLEDPRIVLLGFIEALDDSCRKLNIPGIDTSELLMRFFKIYFSNFDYEEERLLGPVKTRFVELHRFLTGDLVTSDPDGTLKISSSFYKKLNIDEAIKIKKLLDNNEKPTIDAYKEAMVILKNHELKYKKDDTGVIWTNKDNTFELIRSKKRKNIYLVNINTGTVLLVFNEGSLLSDMIAKSEKILK
jgi:hypothetical protein